MSDTYAVAARPYLDAGWSNVLPLPAGAKSPPPSGTTGHSGRDITAADYEAWSSLRGNIAVRVPETVIGLDVDAYNGRPGALTVADRCNAWGALPAAPKSTSRADGSAIYWFSVPEGLKWPGQLGPAVEIIQHGHRYAVVWPSVHPEGRPYRWFDPDGNPLIGVPDVEDLPALPARWVDGLTGGELYQPEAVGDSAPIIRSLMTTTNTGVCRVVPEALAAALADMVAPGGRHDAARDHTLILIRLGEQGHEGAAEALDRLRGAFTHGIQDRGTVGAAEAEWRRLVEGAARRVAGSPTAPADKGCCGVAAVDPVAESLADYEALAVAPAVAADPTVAVAPAVAPAVDMSPREMAIEARADLLEIDQAAKDTVAAREAADRFAAAGLPAIAGLPDLVALHAAETQEWRFAGLAETSDRILIEAANKTGKSTLIGNIVTSLLSGSPLLGVFDTKPIDAAERVLLIDTELGPRKQARWLNDSIPDAHKNRALVWSIAGKAGALDITADSVRAQVVATIRAQGPIGALVVDVAGAWTAPNGIDENSNSEVRRWLEALHSVAQDSTTTGQIILAHHTGLNGTRSRGASAWRDWPDAIWTLTKNDEGKRFIRAHGRDINLAETPLRYDKGTRALTAVVTQVLPGDSSMSARGAERWETA